MNCTACTTPLPAAAAFCGSCGARVARADRLTGLVLDDRYRLEAKLAAGGFGAIYRATDLPHGRTVAIKILHADLAGDRHLSARFRREAAALASLRDPHTVATFAHGETDDGTLYIAMELLTGRSLLAEFRLQGPLPWRRMLGILRGVCSSLIEAHALGIVHRDLKPANIHLERRGAERDFVKVLDFGIAKVLDGSAIHGDSDDGDSELTRVGQAIGTLDYMSPEQLVGGETDGRSDLYTLGVVAYEMIAGRRPFADATGPTSLVTALMTRTPVPLASLFHRECFPSEVDALVQRLLERDPADRFASASELAVAIDAILAEAAPLAAFAPAITTTTLPGVASLRLAPAGSSVAPRPTTSGQLHIATDDGEVTSVDAIPLFSGAFDPAERPARSPRLHALHALAALPARGSGVAPLGTQPRVAHADGSGAAIAPPEQLAQATPVVPPPTTSTPSTIRAPIAAAAAAGPRPLSIAAWAAGLLAAGVALGMLVAQLAA